MSTASAMTPGSVVRTRFVVPMAENVLDPVADAPTGRRGCHGGHVAHDPFVRRLRLARAGAGRRGGAEEPEELDEADELVPLEVEVVADVPAATVCAAESARW